MALFTASYSDFRAAVRNYLDVPDLTTTSLDDIIYAAERRLQRLMRTKAQLTAMASLTMTSGELTFPTNYLEAKYLYIDGTPRYPLQKKTAEWIQQNYRDRSLTGAPIYYAEAGDRWIFGPAPDSSTYALSGHYYKQFTPMPDSGTIHAFFTAYPELHLWAALAEAEPFLSREDRDIWEKKLARAIKEIKMEDKRAEASGSPLRTTTQVHP